MSKLWLKLFPFSAYTGDGWVWSHHQVLGRSHRRLYAHSSASRLSGQSVLRHHNTCHHSHHCRHPLFWIRIRTWIRIQSCQWIRIRIQEAENEPKKYKKVTVLAFFQSLFYCLVCRSSCLKASLPCAVLTNSGSRFHLSTTLTANEYFLTSVRAYCVARPCVYCLDTFVM